MVGTGLTHCLARFDRILQYPGHLNSMTFVFLNVIAGNFSTASDEHDAIKVVSLVGQAVNSVKKPPV